MPLFKRKATLSPEDELRNILRPTERQGPCDRCGKTWWQAHSLASAVCPCGVTCTLPGSREPRMKRAMQIVADWSDEKQVAFIKECIEQFKTELPEDYRIQMEEEERAAHPAE